MKNIVNCDDVSFADENAFTDTPWFDETMKSNFVRLGDVLLYFKTDLKIIDFNSVNSRA